MMWSDHLLGLRTFQVCHAKQEHCPVQNFQNVISTLTHSFTTLPYIIKPPPGSLNHWHKQDRCTELFWLRQIDWLHQLNVTVHIKTHQTRWCFSNLFLSYIVEWVKIATLGFLLLTDRNGSWCDLLLLLLYICFKVWHVGRSEMIFHIP